MATTYNIAFKNVWITEVKELFATRTFQFLDASNTVLGSATIPNPAFGTAADGEAPLATTFDVEITTGGTAAKYRAYIDGGTAYQEGVVATSGGDLNIASLSLNSGDTIRIATWNLTFP